MHDGMTYVIETVDFDMAREALREVRETVFVDEQAVTLEEEWDGVDSTCRHVLAQDGNDAPIGTGRLSPDGHIGRMAVLESWRGRGVGGAILEALIALARQDGMRQVELLAQLHALPFYARHGFEAFGEEVYDARILHRRMVLTLDSKG